MSWFKKNEFFRHLTLSKAALLLIVGAIGVYFATGVYMLGMLLISPAFKGIPEPFASYAASIVSIIIAGLLAMGHLWAFTSFHETLEQTKAYMLEKYGPEGNTLDPNTGQWSKNKQGMEDWFIWGLAILIIGPDLAALGTRLLYAPAQSWWYEAVGGVILAFLPWVAGTIYHVLSHSTSTYRLGKITTYVSDGAIHDVELAVKNLPLAYRLRIQKGEDPRTVVQEWMQRQIAAQQEQQSIVPAYATYEDTSPKLQALPEYQADQQSQNGHSKNSARTN